MLHRLFISLLALVGTTLGGGVACPGTAQAQGSDINLAVSIEVPALTSDQAKTGPTITLTNSGSDTAYAVDVVIEADNISLDPTPNKITVPPIGSVTLRDSKLIWSIDRVPGRSTYAYTVVLPAPTTEIKVVQYVATVSSRTTLEPEGLRHDNRAEVWQTRNGVGPFTAARSSYAVSVAVDDRSPAEQGDVTFTVMASIIDTAPDYRNDSAHLRDAQVTIPLPKGLTYKSATAPTDTSYNSSTKIWTIGDWHLTGSPLKKAHSLTLTATRAANTVLNEQCVTAEISAKPPEPLARTGNNRSTVCLGRPPDEPVLLRSGDVANLTMYPCVGTATAATTYPCDSKDTVEATIVSTTRARGKQIFKPKNVTIHVDETTGRVIDNATGSVNGSGKVSWQTASVWPNGTEVGVSFNESIEPFNDLPSTPSTSDDEIPDWDNQANTLAVISAPSNSRMKVRYSINDLHSDFVYYDPNPSTTNAAFPLQHREISPLELFAEFSMLGTYAMQFTTAVTHATVDKDGDSNPDTFSDTETFTFHVGPIAELAVRDAGPNPAVPSSQRAFTLMALNNGPDTAPAAQVTVDLQGATVSQAIASQGSYDRTTDIWTIGELPVNDSTIAPTLTFITTAPVDTEITATITNTQDYEVCISSTGTDLSHTTQATCEAVSGASWHTAKYYDYKSANNTAPITAQAGTHVATPTADITVAWTAQTGASTYQIWRQGSPWTLIGEVAATQTTYTDTTATPGKAYVYAVRALDAQGIPVSSETVVAAAPRVVTRTVISGGSGSTAGAVSPTGPTRVVANAVGPTRILVYWTGPRILYGEAVTSYEVEVSHDLDHWTTVAPYVEVASPTPTGERVATKHTHTGLQPATTYHYRVYAHNRRGRSLASAVVSATTDDPRVLTGYLENPAPGSFQSGVGVIHGWECDADEVIVQINGTPSPAVYGTERPDTLGPCGDTDNGFELLLNWNDLGNGLHEVVVIVDGTELGRARVVVTTLGAPFRHGLSGTCAVPDFPALGETVTLVWQEARQNFVITNGQTPPTFSSTGSSARRGFLENPAPNTWQSGIGPLSGWVCNADDVTLRINGRAYPVPYGLERIDTLGPCGDIDNGFGTVFNWNELGTGEHVVEAVADGEVFDRATVWVKTLGESFVRDVVGTCEVPDFPAAGETATLEWQEAQQNFVITAVE